jgi:anthranilate/para-aminobenzoate synthase component I
MSGSPRSPLVEELVPPPEPAAYVERLDGLPHRLCLDSAARDLRLDRYSHVAADPFAVVRTEGRTGDPFATVRDLLAPRASTAVPGLPPLQGGAAGYIAYDWGLTLERLPEPTYDDLGLDDLLRAAFPGGSIPGAPKLRASVTGELDASIAIRTAVVRNGRVYFNAGRGIVADSDPAGEYQETLDKGISRGSSASASNLFIATATDLATPPLPGRRPAGHHP